MIRVYGFTCGTSIYFTDDGDNYIIEEPGRHLTFFGFSGDTEWKFVNVPRTYAKWLEDKRTAKRSKSTEILFKIFVDNCEEEFTKGLRY